MLLKSVAMAITTDHWCDMIKNSHQGFTAHVITPQLAPAEKSLGLFEFPEAEKASRFDIVFVTNNGSNLKAAYMNDTLELRRS
jgi:hypothetical protein